MPNFSHVGSMPFKVIVATSVTGDWSVCSFFRNWQCFCFYEGAPTFERARNWRRNNQKKSLVAIPGRLIEIMESKQVDVMRMTECWTWTSIARSGRLWKKSDLREILFLSARRPDSVRQIARDFLKTWQKVNVASKTLRATHHFFFKLSNVSGIGKTS